MPHPWGRSEAAFLGACTGWNLYIPFIASPLLLPLQARVGENKDSAIVVQEEEKEARATGWGRGFPCLPSQHVSCILSSRVPGLTLYRGLDVVTREACSVP